MSLKAFHILFITAASLIAFVFGLWSWKHGVGRPWLPLAAVACGLALIAYGVWFVRRIRTPDEEQERRRKLLRPLIVLLALATLGTDPAWACPACFGQARGPMLDAARLGVWLLFGLVGTVQLGFALFFWHLYRRAKKHASRPHVGGSPMPRSR